MKRNNLQFLLFLLLLFQFQYSLFAQDELKPVRLSEEKEAWLSNDLQKALQLILPSVQKTNSDPVSLYNAGYLYYLSGQNANALDFMQKAMELQPDYPHSYLIVARIYKQSGNLLGAKNLLERGLEKQDSDYDLLLEYANVLSQLNELLQAEKILIKAIDKNGDKMAPRIALASLYRAQGNYEKAQSYLQISDSQFPESKLLLEKSALYNVWDDTARAVEYLTQLCLEYPFSESLNTWRDTLVIKFKQKSPPKVKALPVFNYKIDPGESLDYKVSYGFITLGWLKVRVLGKLNIDDREIFHIIFYVDSNPSFDFIISLHHIYESFIDSKTLNAYRSRLYTPGDDTYMVRMYYFDYDKNLFRAQMIHNDGRFERTEKDLPRSAQDGTSMLYFARGLISNKSGGRTTAVIDEEYKYVLINYLNQNEDVEIRDQEINALKIFANAEFEGVAGMNGDAWGWFSQDKNYVPLVGKIKIIVGSITVTLE